MKRSEIRATYQILPGTLMRAIGNVIELVISTESKLSLKLSDKDAQYVTGKFYRKGVAISRVA